MVIKDMRDAAEVSSGGGDRGLIKEVLTLGGLTAVSIIVIYCAVILITELVVAGISPQREQELFEGAASGMVESRPVPKALREKFALCEEILEKLREHETVAQIDYRLVYLEDLEPNALAIPGGTIGITRGLSNALDEEIGFAFVIAHELGHFANRDHLRGLGRQLGFSTGARLLFGAELDTLSRGTVEVIGASYSRKHEAAADDFAIRSVLETYGETEGAEALFTVLGDAGAGPSWAYMFSTHPDNQSRIRRILEERKKR